MKPTSSASQCRESLRLLLEPGSVAELRVLGTPKGTVSGYFDDQDELARVAAEWSGRAEGVYVTLNPVNPDLLARAVNHVVARAKHSTSDRDILYRRWLPQDFDPIRPAGISATEDQHQLALDRARLAQEWLVREGWPKSILADSGNGAHLLTRIDLPNDDASRRLIKRVLEALSLRFGDDRVAVDLTTFNAARIWKVYGTLAAKGDSTPDRPHRLARLVEVP